ncbi:hypothetical protein PG989_004447 [Apiospora arundinis]
MADKVQQSAPAAAAEKSLGDPPPTDRRGEHDSEKSSNAPQVEPSDAKPTVLITGCSEGGIGAALALQFWERGYHVYATARDVGKIGAPLSSLSDVSLLTLDVTKPEHIREAAAVVERQTGGRGLDVLVNNAGKAHFMPLLDDDLDDVRNTIEVNYVAPLAVTQAFAPSLIKAKGVSVYITSLAGYLNIPYVGIYAGLKRATEIMAETLRLELQPFGVDVMELVTGGVQSNGQKHYDDWRLPEGSRYKRIEPLIKKVAQGHDEWARMDTMEYAAGVVDEIISRRTKGRLWCGGGADMTKGAMVPAGWNQDAMDAMAAQGQGLDLLGKGVGVEEQGKAEPRILG